MKQPKPQHLHTLPDMVRPDVAHSAKCMHSVFPLSRKTRRVYAWQACGCVAQSYLFATFHQNVSSS
jgi:hypothetical protein